MAGTVAAGAIVKIAARLGTALAMEPEKILQLILLAFFVPIAVLAIFFVAPAAMVETVPMALPSHVQFYVDAAEGVNDKYGLSLDWQELVALDAVLLEQDFSLASKSRAESLAELFVHEEVKDATDETEVVYRQLALVEAMVKKNLNDTQQRQVAMFLSTDLKRLRDGGVTIPPGWTPNPWSRFAWPLPEGYYAVTSTFGPRVFEGVGEFHVGLDVGASRGTPVLAADGGIVTYADWRGTAGRAVIIQHTGGYETRYYHLNSLNVKLSQEVNQGEMIGTVGSTGKSTGNHLHFEVRRWAKAIDPFSFF